MYANKQTVCNADNNREARVCKYGEEIYMINQITDIVREASLLMKNKNTHVEQKGNASNYVTDADVNVQNFLTAKLLALLPGSTVVGEENDKHQASDGYLWVIDPIDGTSNFIRGMGLSVISVGLLKEGKPYIGVIYFPYRDEMYWAETGKGAFMNGTPIHVSDRDYAHSHLCSAMSLYDKKHAKACFNIIEKIYNETDDLRRLGSAALELAFLAAGRVELYFEIRVFAWDVAAAATIIKEAGGFIEFLFHDDLPIPGPFGIIAANTEENFNRLKEIVYGELPAQPY